jgi:hypothetical protein
MIIPGFLARLSVRYSVNPASHDRCFGLTPPFSARCSLDARRGFVLVMDIVMDGPLIGASMNPARTLGLASFTGETGYLWIYLVVLCWVVAWRLCYPAVFPGLVSCANVNAG